MEPRRSHVPPITGLVQVPVGAEGSAPFHPAAVLPTLDSHVGVHHSAGIRCESAGAATGRLQLRERPAVCSGDLNRAQ